MLKAVRGYRSQVDRDVVCNYPGVESYVAMWDDDVLLVDIPYVSFAYLSVRTIINYFQYTVRDRGLRLSIATNLNEPLAKNNCSLCLSFVDVPFFAHVVLLLTVAYKLFAMCGQKNSFCMESYIRH